MTDRGESSGAGGGSVALLPRGARPPFRVWVNGVEQHEGADYVVTARGLRFSKPLAKEGKLGFWRWTLIFFGIAGSYRRNDSVDVQYEAGGRTRLVTGLEIVQENGGEPDR
jgi:hypothetical protein